MYLGKNHPWNPGYAIPDEMLDEPENRAISTETVRRGSVDYMPIYPRNHPWNPGYALPKYIYKEMPGAVRVTAQLPRRTVDYMPNDGAWIGANDMASLGDVLSDLTSDPKKLMLLAAGVGALYFFFLRKR